VSRWPEDPRCAETRETVELYLDGELDGESCVRIRAHLERCSTCAAQIQLAREIQSELRSLPELEAPAPVLERILERTVHRRRPAAATRWWAIWPRPVWGALAAAGLALVLGLAVFSERGSTPEPVLPDAATLERATAEARYALAKTGLLTAKAGAAVRDKALRDRVVRPTRQGLNQALGRSLERPIPSAAEGVEDV
jgi:mycothiol system anti-sigma-R factor